jgi:hypothetical protein
LALDDLAGRYLARSCSGEQIDSSAEKRKDFAVTIIEIRRFRNGWQMSDASGVQPIFLNQGEAIDYATCLIGAHDRAFSAKALLAHPTDSTLNPRHVSKGA